MEVPMDMTNASDYYPPSYVEATRQHSSLGGGMTFVDFLPNCTVPGGWFSQPDFEPFKNLLDRANLWLTTNSTWEVKTCESVEFRVSYDTPNTEKMTYFEYGEHRTYFIRGLRLWLVPRTDPDRPAQQIGYTNLIPKITGQQPGSFGVFAVQNYESLNEVLNRMNLAIHVNPIPGRVLTIESQEMKMPYSGNLDPDRCYWSEHGDHSKHFMFVIRIFYEYGEPALEEIGVADFVPVVISEGGLFTAPRFEPFSSVIARSSQWCASQQNLRFCNAQSVEIKLKQGNAVDTQRMSYTEHAERTTYYVRVLRIAYTKPIPGLRAPIPESPSLHLTCKTFVPVQLTRGLFMAEFESLSETKTRIEAWTKATGARILSAETVAMRLFTGGEAYEGIEASFTYNRGNMNEYWIFVVRVYLDGEYTEPPPELLPSVPEIERQDCCSIL